MNQLTTDFIKEINCKFCPLCVKKRYMSRLLNNTKLEQV